MMETILTAVVGMYQTNCYILKDEGHVCIIDPGKKAERIISMIQEDEIVDAILLTHGHFDHIGAVDELVKYYHCPVYVNENDHELLTDTSKNTASGMIATVTSSTQYFHEGKMKIGHFEFDIIFAPGHTEGCTLIQYKNHLFTGDVLFFEGIGRTDLYGGNMNKMRQSLNVIKSFNPNLIVYPGHGPTSTIEHELAVNPYF
ncbi:MBL fold metallo-hydrolase [Anaerorhabdus sp.]|uniref:MBL fold metallo-hydrolase n=2 Tax=Anaerorhabdus sp. TaxID=1872524 RepID=UPI002FC90CEA